MEKQLQRKSSTQKSVSHDRPELKTSPPINRAVATKKLNYKQISSQTSGASFSVMDTTSLGSVWAPSDIDKLEVQGLKDFKKIINNCRFFYRREPIASTVIDKMTEIAIENIIFEKNGLNDNEFRIFTSIKDELLEFMETCALEYLVTGIVIPEIKYGLVTKERIKELGVKKTTLLELPVSMWLRDPATVEIKSSQVLDEPSYFIVLPEDVIYFIEHKGEYQSGEKDEELYRKLLTYYPEFVAQVLAGNKKLLYKNDLICRRKVITGTQYPKPFLYSALETLKHKRNLRRMDYSIAARVIAAIMLVRLGNDMYPVTEDDEKAFEYIKNQMMWRNSAERDVERIFQLFANHTLEIDWIMPDVTALLDDKKYSTINQEIFYALGFPRILTVGETERTQASDPQIATISPVKTMENMNKKLLKILKNIVYNISIKNNLKAVPLVRFEKINLMAVADFIAMMKYLYETSNISRETLANSFGYIFSEEVEKRAEDEKLVESLGIPEFSPAPFSPQPRNTEKKPTENKTKETQKVEKTEEK